MKTLALAFFLLARIVFAQASASAETVPISTPTGANDTAVWVHPTDVSKSLVFGTDQLGGGLYSYALDGGLREFLNLGTTRAVDVRYGLKRGAGSTDVVVAVGVNGAYRLLAPDPDDGGRLFFLDGAPTQSGSSVSAAALSVGSGDRSLMIYVSDFSGNLRHYQARDDGQGKLTPTLLRTLALGAPVEGLVADDRSDRLFLTLANRGLFVVGAANGSSTTPLLVDSLDAGRLAGAKGVALYYTADGGGYVIASASQSSRFAVYALSSGFPFVTSFNLIADGGNKGATNTSGIDLVPISLGPPFNAGLFVAHDQNNVTGPNYKLVKWEAIASSTSPALAVDLRVDPRLGFFDAGAGDAGKPEGGTRCPLDAGAGDSGSMADSGTDSCQGTGGGSATAGPVGGGGPSGSGGGVAEPKGCSCSSAALLFPLAALAGLIRRRSRARA